MSETTTPPAKPARSPEAITADLERARQSLAGNITALQEYVKPANVVGRAGDRIKGIYIAPDGSPKVKQIAITVVVVGILMLYRIRK